MLKFFDVDAEKETFLTLDPRSGMKKNSDLVSGISIPGPQHLYVPKKKHDTYSRVPGIWNDDTAPC